MTDDQHPDDARLTALLAPLDDLAPLAPAPRRAPRRSWRPVLAAAAGVLVLAGAGAAIVTAGRDADPAPAGSTAPPPASATTTPDATPIRIERAAATATGIDYAGSATVFEGTVAIRVRQGDRILADTFTTASCGAPCAGTFAGSVALPPGTAGDVVLEAFWRSPESGLEQDLVRRRVVLATPVPGAASAAGTLADGRAWRLDGGARLCLTIDRASACATTAATWPAEVVEIGGEAFVILAVPPCVAAVTVRAGDAPARRETTVVVDDAAYGVIPRGDGTALDAADGGGRVLFRLAPLFESDVLGPVPDVAC